MEENPEKKIKPDPETDPLRNHPVVLKSIRFSRETVEKWRVASYREREARTKNEEYERTIEMMKHEMNKMLEETKNKNVEYERTIEMKKQEMNKMSDRHEAEVKDLQNKIDQQEKETKQFLKTAGENLEYERMTKVIKQEHQEASHLHEAHINLLQKKLEEAENDRKRILNENLQFKKEICDLYKKPVSDVPPPPRNDTIAYPGIDQSEAVIFVSDLLGELLLCNTVPRKKLTPTNMEKVVSCVCTVAKKLLSGTKEQVNRALYLLARSFYSNKALAQLVGRYNNSNLEKLLLPSEYAVVCGFENTMKEIPPLAEILKMFSTKLEFELLTDGQLSHCRVYAAICQLLNDTYTPFRICKELLLRKGKKGLIFIATIASVYPGILSSHFKPDEPMDTETKIFYNFILSKPNIHMLQVAQCHRIFTTLCDLPLSSPFNFQDLVKDVSQTLGKDFVSEPSGNLSNLISIKLIALQMGNLWSVSNILYPLLEKIKSQRMAIPKQICQIIKICSKPE